MIGAAFQHSNTTNDLCLDLYNNATDGSNLHLYYLVIFNDAQGMWAGNPHYGHGANFVANALPVITGAPSPPGQVYQDVVGSSFSGSNTIPNVTPLSFALMGGEETGSCPRVAPPGPLSVILPG